MLEILKIYLKNLPLGTDVDLTVLTGATKGYSGADIRALCNEAAMNAVRRNDKTVIYDDFKKAMNEIGPSITPDMETWYKGTAKQFRRPIKPGTIIA